MSELLTIQQNLHSAKSVSSLTRSGSTATATTATAHGYASGDYVTMAGADQGAYNGLMAITVTGGSTFTFPVSGSPTTPATGTITALYTRDSDGGQVPNWTTVATIRAELVPMRASERLQAQQLGTAIDSRFRAYQRTDLTTAMRALWTPSWGGSQQTLEIKGVQPDVQSPQRQMWLECSQWGGQ